MKKLLCLLFLCTCIFFTPNIGVYEAFATSDTSEMSANSDTSKTSTSSNTTLDTSHWLTFPVGRYLIDLPPSAKLYWHPLRFSGEFDLVWKKDMTMEQAKELLMQEAEEAKKAPHKSGKSQFIGMHTDFGVNGNSIILMRHPNKNSSSQLLKTYFVNLRFLDKNLNKKRKRIYYYEEKVLGNVKMISETLEFIDYMADHVLSTYPTYPTQPISVAPGTYFEGGYFFGPSNSPYPAHEQIGIEVTFPEYPGIEFSIFFNHLNLDTNAILGHITPYEPGVIRKAQTTIAGNPADEVLKKFEENGITHYSFSLNGPSTRAAKRIDQIPIITMYLKNPTTGIIRDGVDTTKPPIRRPSFKSDEEAMAFWDAIRKSIRWRPDHWRIKDAPRKQYYLVGGKIIPYVVPTYDD